MRQLNLVICLGALAWATLPALAARAQAARPNIVHIFADDLGWGSVGFNGQSQIATPNLDAIASAGMRLTNAYATPVCAPSRATLLTGFHQGHASVDGNNGLSTGFRAEDVMTAQVLAPAGYTSAIYGKWGFGASGVRNLSGSDPLPSIDLPNSLPTNHGFDTFYGYLNHGAAHDYFYSWMWRNDAGAPHGVSTIANAGGPGGNPAYTHDIFAARSELFVADHANDDDPFYLQVNYTIPHWDIDAIANATGGYGIYAGQSSWSPQEKAYAAMITRMDASIGALMARLNDPNGDGNTSDSIAANTLVLFTSDNGPTLEDNSPINFFNANGVYRGGKFEVYEGGIHMPAVAYWPGTIAADSSSDYRTDLADFMATAADLAGVEAPVGIDGVSIVPTLTGEGRQRQREYLVFEHQGAHGQDPDPRIGRWAVIRQDGKKLIHYDNGTEDLFDLVADPDESSPLSLGVPANAQTAAELQSVAIAEGLLGSVVEYRTWNGPSGGNVQDDANWDGVGPPNGYWSAVVANYTAMPSVAHVTADVATLGIEVRGQSAAQVVEVHAGHTLTGRNEVRVGALGEVQLSGGTLASNRWVNVRAEGQITGQGTVQGDVYSEGLLSPGHAIDPTSKLIVQGDLFHLGGGAIAIELGGHDAGIDYDTLEVFGEVELEGDLVVSLSDAGGSPFAPALGNSFTILSATQGVLGEFDDVALPSLSIGLDWRVDYLTNAVMLSVLATADFNGDGMVDAADYVVWRKIGGTPEQYDLWRASFGTTVGSGSGATQGALSGAHVPEPATAWMLLIAAAVRVLAGTRHSTRESLT